MAKFKPWNGTQAAYNAISTKDTGTMYCCLDTQNVYKGSVPVILSTDKIDTSSTSQTKSGSLAILGTLTLSNALGIASGGTGKNSIASGSMLYASANNSLSEVVTSSFGRGLLNTQSGSIVTGLNADTLDGNHASAFALTGHTHSYATPSQLTDGSVTRIGTSSVGANNRPIYLNAGTPTVASVGESFLTWGGQNFSGSYGPIDAAMVPVLGANRLAFTPASAITVEYSRDGGNTWLDYGASDDQKIKLFSGMDSGLVIGKADVNNKATDLYKLRVTINTGAASVYTQLNKFVILASTNGSSGTTCTITARTQENYTGAIDNWVTFSDHTPISGWSGFNVINTGALTTYGNTPTDQYGQVRFLFEATGGSTTYYGLQVPRIYGFGGVGWNTPSAMARIGSLYGYDSGQNAIFPAAVRATTFTENGTVLASKYAGIAQTHYIGTTAIAANRASANIALTGITSIDGNSASATKLQTSRTIFGKAFDGSTNISGKVLCNGAYAVAGNGYNNAAVEIREADLVAAAQSTDLYAPRLAFHWSGRSAASIIYNLTGFKFENQAQTGYADVTLRSLFMYGSISGATTGNFSGLLTASAGVNTTNASLSGSLFIRTSYNTYRDTNTGSDSLPMCIMFSGYPGKYQALDAGPNSQSWNFINENTSGNRIRCALINAWMTQTTAGAEKGTLNFWTKTAGGGMGHVMRMDDVQNVLIGYTTNPASYRLAVSGSGYFSSNLTVAGSLTVTGSITASTFYQID